MKTTIEREYKNWLVCKADEWCMEYGHAHYQCLLQHLYSREFTWTIPNDGNRAVDGRDMRMRFVELQPNYDYRTAYLYLDNPCNVLEMMVGLITRLEDYILGYEENRIGSWFWKMLESMDLTNMDDLHYDGEHVEEAIDDMLYRNYEGNGKGGLFTVDNPREDLRGVEIWYQMLWYVDEVIFK